MADIKVNITVDTYWIKEDGECAKCLHCEDMIFGSKHTLYLITAVGSHEAEITETPIVLCDSCNNLYDN